MSSDKPSNCKVSNIGYEISCQLCKRRGIERSYQGESSRSAYLRGQEQFKDLQSKKETSALFKHVQKEHEQEEDEVEFKMKVTGRFKNAMNRQLDEGIRIQSKPPETLLNSKTEYHGPVIKRKVIERKGNLS